MNQPCKLVRVAGKGGEFSRWDPHPRTKNPCRKLMPTRAHPKLLMKNKPFSVITIIKGLNLLLLFITTSWSLYPTFLQKYLITPQFSSFLVIFILQNSEKLYILYTIYIYICDKMWVSLKKYEILMSTCICFIFTASTIIEFIVIHT